MNTFFKPVCCLTSLVLTTALFSPGCAAQGSPRIRPISTSALTSNTSNTSNVTKSEVASPAQADLKAAEEFLARFQTTKGEFTIRVKRAWAPNAADRFYSMIKAGYFDGDMAIYRAIEGFMFQFGIHGDPQVNAQWAEATIPDDPAVGISNTTGTISFAQTQNPGSRSVQMFVNLGMNSMLDTQQPGGGTPFVPFGEVVRGADVLRKINTDYGENPRGENIQGNFKAKGNEFILDRFPRVDLIESVTIVEEK